MKYSWKGRKDRNRHKNRKKEWASKWVGLCQKPKPRRPHHVKVSPRGSQNKTFWKATHRTMSMTRLQNIYFLEEKKIDCVFAENWCFGEAFSIPKTQGNQPQSAILWANQPEIPVSELANQNLFDVNNALVNIDETSTQKAGIYQFSLFPLVLISVKIVLVDKTCLLWLRPEVH